MRYISFFLTQQQVRDRIKTVTWRTGWGWVKKGEILQPIEKGQGLKAGQGYTFIGSPITILDNRPEPLSRLIEEPEYGSTEAALEGFPGWSGEQFVSFICKQPGVYPERVLNRLEFEYV